jgi:hypothetical protein
MRELVVLLLAIFLTWLVLAGVGLSLIRWRMARSNRVSPAVRSAAPMRWLWSYNRGARLHRRLRAAVALIHLAPSRRVSRLPSLSVDELRRDLEHQAVVLDQHLVVAVHHPRSHRRSLLVTLETQVTEVERLAVRLSSMSRPDDTPSSGWDTHPTSPEALERISSQLDLLDTAQAELVEIERASGLVDVDQLLAETHTPVAVTPPPPPSGSGGDQRRWTPLDATRSPEPPQ